MVQIKVQATLLILGNSLLSVLVIYLSGKAEPGGDGVQTGKCPCTKGMSKKISSNTRVTDALRLP